MPLERRFPGVLVGFLALSLLAHAATFFLFQVTYPPRVTIPPRPTQVAVLTGEGPEQQELLRWIESEDPALVASSAHPVPAELFEVPYRPSYMVSRTPPRSLPPAEELPARAPGPELTMMIPSAEPTTAETARKVPEAKTKLLFSSSLQSRAPAAETAGVFKTASTAPVQEVTVYLGIDAAGKVLFSFVQKPSGDSRTDAAALAALARLPFAPAADPAAGITWGFATIIWGDDAFPAPAPAPAPK
jgi:TonB family protein